MQFNLFDERFVVNFKEYFTLKRLYFIFYISTVSNVETNFQTFSKKCAKICKNLHNALKLPENSKTKISFTQNKL
jgi:hypothetical protein